ncbi:MAG: hypothetical protein AVDCRST_MAG26-3352, partial [uncultured Chloroflexia bacterium]
VENRICCGRRRPISSDVALRHRAPSHTPEV